MGEYFHNCAGKTTPSVLSLRMDARCRMSSARDGRYLRRDPPDAAPDVRARAGGGAMACGRRRRSLPAEGSAVSVFLRPTLARCIWTTPLVSGLFMSLTLAIRHIYGGVPIYNF